MVQEFGQGTTGIVYFCSMVVGAHLGATPKLEYGGILTYTWLIWCSHMVFRCGQGCFPA